jgi:hypothetical protein
LPVTTNAYYRSPAAKPIDAHYQTIRVAAYPRTSFPSQAVTLTKPSVHARHGVQFDIRIGLNSGEVMIGRISDDLSMDYTALGHDVGLAQRMESLAEPGHIRSSRFRARLNRVPFLNTYRTTCLAPLPEFRQLLEWMWVWKCAAGHCSSRAMFRAVVRRIDE